MDDIVYLVVLIVVWALSSVFRKMKAQRAESVPSQLDAFESLNADTLQNELSHAFELAETVDALTTWLRNQPKHAQVLLPLVEHVIARRVSTLIRTIQMAVDDQDLSGIWALRSKREGLGALIAECSAESQRIGSGYPPQSWIGANLTRAIPELPTEITELVPAQPNLHILTYVDLTRRDLQHVYAVWVKQLFTDLCTAVIHPERARRALKGIEQAANPWSASGEEAPLVIRGRVLSETLGEPLRIAPGDGEIFVTIPGKLQYALPQSVVFEDIDQIIKRMRHHRYKSLGNLTLNALVEGVMAPQSPKTAPLPASSVWAAPSVTSPKRRQRVPASKRSQPGKPSSRTTRLHRFRDAIILDEVYRL
jgi:hypothetical protein